MPIILASQAPTALLDDPGALLDWASQQLYADLLKRTPRHLLVRVNALLDTAPLEQACAAFQHPPGTPGAPPTYSIACFVRALLLSYLRNLSLRALEDELRCNLLARWFCGLPLFGPTPDHTRFHHFETFVLRTAPRLFFDEVLQQLDAAGLGERDQLQAGDTFALRANAAHESLFALLRHVIKRLLQTLQRCDAVAHAELSAHLDHAALYGTPGERRDQRLTLEERATRLTALVRAADATAVRVHAYLTQTQTLRPHDRDALATWLTLFAKVCQDDLRLTRDAAGLLLTVHERGPDEKPKGAYRLVSATDPDATCRKHGAHADDGYNVQIAATAQVIRAIEARPGAEPDNVAIPTLITDQREHHALIPPKLVYDRAAGTGKSYADIAQASDGQTQLIAPLIDLSRRSARFSPQDFVLAPDGQTLTCPNQQSSTAGYAAGTGKGRNFRFKPAQCLGCPLAARCRGDAVPPTHMRQVFISDHRVRVEVARAYLQTPAGQADYKQRGRIERQIACLVRYQGARHARRRGRAPADYQMKMCATAFNLKAWVRRTTPPPLKKAAAAVSAVGSPA